MRQVGNKFCQWMLLPVATNAMRLMLMLKPAQSPPIRLSPCGLKRHKLINGQLGRRCGVCVGRLSCSFATSWAL